MPDEAEPRGALYGELVVPELLLGAELHVAGGVETPVVPDIGIGGESEIGDLDGSSLLELVTPCVCSFKGKPKEKPKEKPTHGGPECKTHPYLNRA